jgi:ribonuclease BN (tRNA processing enzyme)
VKMTFIGAGSAFTTDNNYQSNMLLESDQGKRLLIDCGSDARHALKELGLTHLEIDNIYISHLHGDHVGGLEWIGFASKFDPRCQRPKLYVSQFLKSELWNNVLSGGMRSIQGEIADLDTYFDVLAVPKNGYFVWEDTQFRLVQTIHIMDGYHYVPSFGLLYTVDGVTVFMTTDTQFAPEQIKDFYKRADIIFHDAETAPFESGVHAHYEKLKTLPDEYKNKMWLYHYNPGQKADPVADGFRGFVQKGQVFDFKDPSTL